MSVLGLYRLQQIDTQIDQARVRLEAIRSTLENDQERRAAADRLAMAKTTLREAERAQRQAEAEVQSQRIKLEQAETSLYSGTIRNPKELQDLQKDVISLKKHLVTLEDRLLDAMLACESAAAALDTARAAHAQVEARFNEQSRHLLEEQQTLLHTLERLQAERKAAEASINASLLDEYHALRREKRGLAVVLIRDGACSACGATLTPAQQQVVRSARKILRCPTCGRILFAD